MDVLLARLRHGLTGGYPPKDPRYQIRTVRICAHIAICAALVLLMIAGRAITLILAPNGTPDVATFAGILAALAGLCIAAFALIIAGQTISAMVVQVDQAADAAAAARGGGRWS
jgi:hypothetical protein